MEDGMSLDFRALSTALITKFSTVGKSFWQKTRAMLSGLKAIRGFIWFSTTIIFSSVYSLERSNLTSLVALPHRASQKSIEHTSPDLVNKFEKWSNITWSLSLFFLYIPFASLIRLIKIFCFHCNVLEWKYQVFWSPSISHNVWDHCL